MKSAEFAESGAGAPIAVEILIVGFGFSVIPLLRELVRRGQSFTLVSKGDSIWQQLAKSDRLDFDLVSSYHGSVYSFDQVEENRVDDYYPTAREFYEYQERLFEQYRDKVINDEVTHVENHDEFSLVTMASGRVYRSTHVVFATGLGRPQNEIIKNFDIRKETGKTIVFGTIGDTTNMMMARAVPQGNRVILVNNGFVALDKFMAFDSPGPKGSDWYIPLLGIRTGRRYPLDLAQAESHTMARWFRRSYKNIFHLPVGPPGPDSLIGRLLLPHVLFVKHPETYRAEAAREGREAKAGVQNGLILIKYWPIDTYEFLFGDELEDKIREGVILNDIAYFHSEGLVETWPKEKTSIDLEHKTIVCGERKVQFDHYIGGAAERPRLPPIVSVDANGVKHNYRYAYRENYLGVVPSTLKNIFFIGFSRPTTAGVANVTEMQGLMVHKLVSEPAFTAGIYSDINERLAEYNAFYYPKGAKRKPTDHLVFFGLYTNDVARCIGIDRKLSSCFSWNPLRTINNLRFDLFHPNNSIKFRMQGEYAVEGAEKLCRDIAKQNDNWLIMQMVFLSCLWDQLLSLMCVGLLFKTYGLDPFIELNAGGFEWATVPSLLVWIAFCVAFTVALVRNLYVLNLLTWSAAMPLLGPKVRLQPLAMIYVLYTGDWRLGVALFAVIFGVIFLFRQFHLPPISGRYLFGDCKYKHKYRPFWQRYREAYAKVLEEQRTARRE